MSLSRDILDALLPPGSMWVPEAGQDFDKLLDGIAENKAGVLSYLETLAYIRHPLLTPVLADLEIDYGIVPDDTVPEADRRARLWAAKHGRRGTGRLDYLQAQLRGLGFDVYVYQNDPVVDPRLFIGYPPTTITGNDGAVCGHDGAVCGGTSGALVANGLAYRHQFSGGATCGSDEIVAGNTIAVCHSAGDFSEREIRFDCPVTSGYWPAIFFVGGPISTDGDGRIVTMEAAEVPVARKTELIRNVVKYRPFGMWAAMVIAYK